MNKDDLLIEKENRSKEILKLRSDLKFVNENIMNVRKTVPFYKLIGPALIISIIIGIFLISFNLLDTTKILGIIILVYILGIFATTKLFQKRIKEEKDKNIKIRLNLQKQIVQKGKELTEIEAKLKEIEK